MMLVCSGHRESRAILDKSASFPLLDPFYGDSKLNNTRFIAVCDD